MCALAELLGFSQRYSKGLAIFFMLHYEILSWSSFVNIKDNLVVVLEIMIFASLLKFLASFNVRALISGFLATIALISTRFYVIFLLLSNFVLTSFSFFNYKKSVLFLFIGSIASFYTLVDVFPNLFEFDRALSAFSRYSSFDNPIFEGLRFLLTPSPEVYLSNMEPKYGFCYLALFLHHIFLPLTMIGFIKLSKNRLFFPIALFLIQIVIFYALVPSSIGPRHRYQVVWIFVWCQFHALWALLQKRNDTLHSGFRPGIIKLS